MNELSAHNSVVNDPSDTFISLLSIVQNGPAKKDRTLLKILMDEKGQFDVIQYGPANVLHNLEFWIRSPDNPQNVTRIKEADLRDSSACSLIENIADMLETI